MIGLVGKLILKMALFLWGLDRHILNSTRNDFTNEKTEVERVK